MSLHSLVDRYPGCRLPLWLWLPPILGLACAHPPRSEENVFAEATQQPEASHPQDINALAERYWQEALKYDPIGATLMGERSLDALMPRLNEAARMAHRERLQKYLQAATTLDPVNLSDGDRTTRGQLIEALQNEMGAMDCKMDQWSIDPLGGPQIYLTTLATYQTVANKKQAEDLLARWRKIPDHLASITADLRKAAKKHRFAAAAAVTKVLGQLASLRRQDAKDWPMAQPALIAPGDPKWRPKARQAFVQAVQGVVATRIKPAFARFEKVIEKEILPHARDNLRPGLAYVPGGRGCYPVLIHSHTSLDLAPRDIHQLGLDEIARIKNQMMDLGEKIFGTRDLTLIKQRLREDRTLYFSSRQQIEDKAKAALARAEKVQTQFLQTPPALPCTVERMPAHAENDAPIAYYRPAPMDGSRPGIYEVNTSAPQTRPRFEAEVLAFHEAIPGHHIQIATAQSLTGLPSFRRHQGVTAFVEGWGLYAEKLADELGLYSSDLDRMGMLSFDAWRAGRLVVDTGLHAFGWSRERAIDFLADNTLLADNNIANEVDRYIVWPGQAVAYKVGQQEILKLRAAARKRLGKAFDLRAFHATILGQGAVSLNVLRQQVEAWIAQTATR